MQKNLNFFERGVNVLLGVFFIFAAIVLYYHPLAKLSAAAFGLFSLAEAAVAKCWFRKSFGILTPGDRLAAESRYLIGVLGVQTVMAYEWWSAGWEKLSSGAFVENIGKTFAAFASKNPFPWYKGFLEGFAMKNATVFAYAVEWSQAAIALTLVASVAAVIYAKNETWKRRAYALSAACLIGGMLMNANFYLAAGWTGPGTKGSNIVMFWSQAFLAYVWLTALIRAKRA